VARPTIPVLRGKLVTLRPVEPHAPLRARSGRHLARRAADGLLPEDLRSSSARRERRVQVVDQRPERARGAGGRGQPGGLGGVGHATAWAAMWAMLAACPAARAAATAAGSPTSRAAACARAARARTAPMRSSPRAKARRPSRASRGRGSVGARASNSASGRSAQSAPTRPAPGGRPRSASARLAGGPCPGFSHRPTCLADHTPPCPASILGWPPVHSGQLACKSQAGSMLWIWRLTRASNSCSIPLIDYSTRPSP
jgi:hypothetical protein